MWRIEEYVGKTLRFLITELSEGKNIVLSAAFSGSRKGVKTGILATMAWANHEEGKQDHAYGAFVELSPGVGHGARLGDELVARGTDEVLHMGERSWSRSSGSKEALREVGKITCP